MGGLIFDGVVFDVDGVLFDTERVHREAWRVVSKQMDCAAIVDHYPNCVGKTRVDIDAMLLKEMGADFPITEFFSRTAALCSEWLQEEIPMKPGVREILTFLNEKDIPAGMATSTYRERTTRRLELTGLGRYFHSTTTGDEVSHGKPDPEIYRTACQKLGTDPRRTIAIEDSRNGILSASAAGMQVIMVPDLIAPTPELESHLFRRFDSLLDVRDYLASVL